MLQLIDIRKDYPAGDGVVKALRGVSLRFRRSEFVSILGPSGCGKTTMLNIIGGLDQYSEGDLVINGRSTKHFKDRDWDTYRNHSIGFVFQSYNLIPHQSVLQNVELALTLSGVSRKERRQRAIQALNSVGLGDQLKKKPAEMSGGQMQRVAIARALVNDPEIILADEPTGALDTETSVQVMDILREVAKDRLVVMVTHNPDLAEKYSTRIIRMLDGEITSDTNPVTEDEAEQAADGAEAAAETKQRKPSMSLWTSFSLSLKNLLSKRGRTILTSFAGSIGIIGIALIFSVSQGLTTYIDTLQEDTLSSYPLTLEAMHMNIGSMMETFIGNATSGIEHENDAVYEKTMVYDMVNALGSMETTENDLGAFRNYLEKERAKEDSVLGESLTGVQYTYDVNLQVYTESVDGTIIESNAEKLMQDLMLEYLGLDMSMMMSMSQQSPMGTSSTMTSMSPMATSMKLWQEMLTGNDGELINPVIKKQYELVYGSWPNSYDEVVVVLDENNEIADMTLYALGLKSKEEIDALANAAFTMQPVELSDHSWTYEEICGRDYRVILPSDCFVLNEQTGLYEDLRESETGLKYLYGKGLKLRVTGIIRPDPDAVSGMLRGTIAYTADLTKYIIDKSNASDAVKAQQANPNIDVLTGLPFLESEQSDAERAAVCRTFVSGLTEEEKAAAYTTIVCTPTQDELDAMLKMTLGMMPREQIEAMILEGMSQQVSVNTDELTAYIEAMSDEELMEFITQIAAEMIKQEYAKGKAATLAGMTQADLAAGLDALMATASDADCVRYYELIADFSDSTYALTLHELGYVDTECPSTINLYAATFESKDAIVDAIAAYNESVGELERIEYTDYVGLMMSSITTIIDAITYVLIAFVSISLVVSSIMIGVITLISVQERTKEIGILRAIGASKRNVSSMFSAETLLIGFFSGAVGVLVTYLLCIPINAIIQHLTGLYSLKAYLPWQVALILIGISMLLTLFSGVIPSRSAAKKDPVVALRSE